MRRPVRLPPFCLLTIAMLAAAPPARALASAAELPPGFVVSPIGTEWSSPTGLAFLDESRLLVAEKAGRVWLVEDDLKRNVVIDVASEALNNGDRGLLGIAVDPAFEANGWIYLLLVVDPNQDGSDGEQETFSRLVRYTTALDGAGDLVADLGSRVEILGASWPTGIPSCHLSHAVGTLRFLSDGSLVLSHGDGAHFDLTDAGGHDPGCFGSGRFPADQDVGSFRSLYEGSLAGKVLRIDPATGYGLPDNPFFDGDATSIRSRIWASGLRNPFRFALQPGTGPRETLFVSDVGWNTWEEVNLARGGESFGWPCYEGPAPQASYQANDPHGFCASAGATHVPPLLAWHHTDSSHAGYIGNCAAAIAFYTGDLYPPIYQGALFFSDYGRSWMRVAFLDESQQVIGVVPFGSGLGAPVDLVAEPGTGDLVYATIGIADAVYRLRYAGSNLPPVAVATATPAWGSAPLVVQLSGSSSYDPEQDVLRHWWDLGDGTTSEEADPVHLYADPDVTYRPRLRVTDSLGFESWAELVVTPGNTPPSIDSWTSPAPGELYEVGQAVTLEARASDLEDEANGVEPEVVWHVDLLHDHHEHPDHLVVTGERASFVPDVPYDGTWYRVRLEVRDARGLAVEQSLEIYDVATAPKAHIVEISDVEPRFHETVRAIGHMELPGDQTGGGTPTLTWDWGDGTQEIVTGHGHQQDSTPEHVYATPGSYELTLRAELGARSSVASATVRVLPPRSALAVFVPLVVQRAIPWTEQQAIATELLAVAQAAGREGTSFVYHEQEALAAWMNGYLDDGVNDVLVVLDACPAVAYAGENDGSLAERWLESGNTIVWTGHTPFHLYVLPNGTSSSSGAGFFGADDVLDPSNGLIEFGQGDQELKRPARALPSLAPYYAVRALRKELVGPEWAIEVVYAEDDDADSDAIAIRHASGGVFAQFLTGEGDHPRAAVLSEFLRSFVFRPHAPPEPR